MTVTPGQTYQRLALDLIGRIVARPAMYVQTGSDVEMMLYGHYDACLSLLGDGMGEGANLRLGSWLRSATGASTSDGWVAATGRIRGEGLPVVLAVLAEFLEADGGWDA